MRLLSTFAIALFCGAGLCAAAAATQTQTATPPAPASSQPPQPPAQPPQDPSSPTPTFRTRAAGVSIDALVTDDERPVTGLTVKDFELTDSGVAQSIEVTTLRDLPVDVIIVLDNSTSLREDGLKNLVRATDTLLGSLQPRDRAALVTFSQVVVIRSGLTPRHADVRNIARELKIEGTTSVIDAVFAGTTLQTAADRSSLLLVFSDGIDTASWLRPDQVLATVRRSAVVPYAVVLGEGVTPTGEAPVHIGVRRTGPAEEPFDATARFLRDLVVTGGGVFMSAGNTRMLERHFAEALDSFRQRYVITYVPRGVEGAGWHPVSIKVKGGHRVRARPGYVMP
jgi:VWFA-related protein